MYCKTIVNDSGLKWWWETYTSHANWIGIVKFKINSIYMTHHWEIYNKWSISYQQHNFSVTISMISLSIAVTCTSNTLGSYHCHWINLVYRLRENYRKLWVSIISIFSLSIINSPTNQRSKGERKSTQNIWKFKRIDSLVSRVLLM